LIVKFGLSKNGSYIYINKNKDMTQLKFNFMDGLIIINDEEMLETAIQNLVKELDKEDFNEEEINEFISIKVKRYLNSR
jgi:DNA-binding transcriptional regulator YhcF (GntR family)